MRTNMKQSVFALLTAVAMAMPFALAAGEPEDVNNVIASAKDDTTLTVSWSEAKDSEGNDVNHYRLYYGTQSVLNGDAPSYEVEVDTPDNATTYDLTSLTTGATYYVAVTAIDAGDVESANYSLEASETLSASPESSAPAVSNVLAMDRNHVLVGFSEAVQLPELLAEAAFTITEQINPASVLDVTAATQYANDPEGKTVILTTADQTKNVNYIVTASVAITDVDGNPIESGVSDSGLFLGSDLAPAMDAETETAEEDMVEEIIEEVVVDPLEELLETTTAEEVDVTAPEDITNLLLTFKEELEKFVIIMNWTASLNTAKDLVDQILYMSMDKGASYSPGQSLGAFTTTHQLPNLEGGKEYTFKITTKDDTGNESVGVVKSIRLPQTGLGAGFLVLSSAVAAGRVLRRKKNKDLF